MRYGYFLETYKVKGDLDIDFIKHGYMNCYIEDIPDNLLTYEDLQKKYVEESIDKGLVRAYYQYDYNDDSEDNYAKIYIIGYMEV